MKERGKSNNERTVKHVIKVGRNARRIHPILVDFEVVR